MVDAREEELADLVEALESVGSRRCLSARCDALELPLAFECALIRLAICCERPTRGGSDLRPSSGIVLLRSAMPCNPRRGQPRRSSRPTALRKHTEQVRTRCESCCLPV